MEYVPVPQEGVEILTTLMEYLVLIRIGTLLWQKWERNDKKLKIHKNSD